MKVWLVMEKERQKTDISCDVTLFDTKEKAQKYLEDRDKILYKRYNVKHCIEYMDGSYRKSIFGIRYKCGCDYYSLGIHETEVL